MDGRIWTDESRIIDRRTRVEREDEKSVTIFCLLLDRVRRKRERLSSGPGMGGGGFLPLLYTHARAHAAFLLTGIGEEGGGETGSQRLGFLCGTQQY